MLGALSGTLCLILGINNIISGIGISLMVYFGSDQILRRIFIEKVENPAVVTKTGVGIYLITWIFVWILLFTLQNSF